MSEIKVNKLSARTSNAITIGDTSDVVSTNTAATFKVTREATRDITGDGSTTTALAAGDIALVDVSSATATVQLPASPNAGDIITILDVAQSANSNNITIDRNGKKIENATNNLTLGAAGDMAKLLFTGDTYGWTRTSKVSGDTYVNATGGTETTSGDFKIHTFNSSSNFVVSNTATNSSNNEVSYVVVAGGGGGGRKCAGGGGGAGGFREGKSGVDTYTQSPLNSPAGGITVSAATYPITVGAGGGAAPSNPSNGSQGSDSTFSTITSAGGGFGQGHPGSPGGANGGSGGGGGNSGTNNGSGNTPPVSPPQGNGGGNGNGGGGSYQETGGGGGGAGTSGSNSSSNSAGGNGGAGVTSSITGSSVARAGGGAGGTGGNSGPSLGTGGSGGGGNGANCQSNDPATAATANTGGGGGGGAGGDTATAGGSGVVILRYKYQN